MGLEEKVTAKKGRKTFDGKLHVDSRQLEFRSKEFKWIVELDKKPTAKVSKGSIVVKSGRENVTFDVSSPEKWVKKILNPPNLMTKLGVKQGQRCFVSSGFDKVFKDDIRSMGAKIVRDFAKADLLFLRADSGNQLSRYGDLLGQLDSGINVWVVWPKGSREIGQSDVMGKAKSLGFGPSKTASFDDSTSSMRFAKRKK